MKRRNRFFLQNFQLVVLTITYALSSLFLMGLMVLLLPHLAMVCSFLIFIALLVAFTVLWGYLYVIFNVQQTMSRAFDPVRNRLSTGETKAGPVEKEHAG